MKVYVSESASKDNLLVQVTVSPFHVRVTESAINNFAAGHKATQTKVLKALTDLSAQKDYFKDFDVAFSLVTKSALPFLLRDTTFSNSIKENKSGAVTLKVDDRFVPIVQLVQGILTSCGYFKSEKSAIKEIAKANPNVEKLVKSSDTFAQLIRQIRVERKTLTKATDIKKSEQADQALVNFLKELRSLDRNWSKLSATLTKIDELSNTFVDSETRTTKVDAKVKARSKHVLTDHAQTLATIELLKLLKLKHKGNPALSQIKELSGIAGTADKVQSWLAKKGVNADFNGEYCSAAYMKVNMKWVTKASKASMKSFAASLHQKTRTAEVEGSNVYYVQAKDDNLVAIYIPKNDAQTKEAFIQKVVDKSKSRLEVMTRGLIVPNVSFTEIKDFTKELVDSISKADVDNRIGSTGDFEGKQVTQFDMDEVGARVVQYAMTMTKSAGPRPPVVIDRPFVVVMMRKAVDIPIFAAYCNERTWKKGK